MRSVQKKDGTHFQKKKIFFYDREKKSVVFFEFENIFKPYFEISCDFQSQNG